MWNPLIDEVGNFCLLWGIKHSRLDAFSHLFYMPTLLSPCRAQPPLASRQTQLCFFSFQTTLWVQTCFSVSGSCLTHLRSLLLLLLDWASVATRTRLPSGVSDMFFFPLQCFFPISVSDKFWAQSLWTRTHNEKEYNPFFLPVTWEDFQFKRASEILSLSNDATVPKQINLLWKFQEPAALSSQAISFVYRVVLLPDWCANRGSANASWHLSYSQKKKIKNPLWCFLMRKPAPNPNPLPV